MGSFTEFIAAFEIRPDAPDEVLAVFAPFRADDEQALPSLPDLDEDELTVLEEFLEIAYYDEVDLAGVSTRVLSHLWKDAFSDFWPVGFSGSPSTVLRRHADSWHVTTRTYFKSYADPICSVFAPLANFICPWAGPDHPSFVGYLRFEGDDRPILVWHHGGATFVYEDSRERPSDG